MTATWWDLPPHRLNTVPEPENILTVLKSVGASFLL